MNEKATMSDKATTNDKAATNDKAGRIANVRHYTDERIDVSYDATRCIHAAECVHRLPAVFDTARRPWILPSGAGADDIAAVVARCPTGALHAIRLDGGTAEGVPAENSIVPTPNGPLYVHGQLHLRTPEGDVTVDDVRMALCRCGQSRNKPFCDNSHRDASFRDPGAIAGANMRSGPDANATPSADANADATTNAGASANAGSTDARDPIPLSIVPTTDGPLALEGAFLLRTSDGSAQHYAVKATLCRCGASGRKPFCDGSHRRIGFRSAPPVDETPAPS